METVSRLEFRDALGEERERVEKMLSQYRRDFGQVSRDLVVAAKYIQALNGLLKYHGLPLIETDAKIPATAN